MSIKVYSPTYIGSFAQQIPDFDGRYVLAGPIERHNSRHKKFKATFAGGLFFDFSKDFWLPTLDNLRNGLRHARL